MWVQVFVFLLRLVHPDARKALVRESLDVLTPFLAKRRQEAGAHSLAPLPGDSFEYPTLPT